MLTKDNEGDISKIVVDCAYKVHVTLGAGLLESSYQTCMAYEMTKRGLTFEKEKPVSIMYDNCFLETAYRLDFLVEDKLIIELKAFEGFKPIHAAQILTYLRHSNIKTGLLINFNVLKIKEGIKRISY
jgi:GxxExxY protein